MIISKDGNFVNFEAFEILPPDAVIMQSKGRLKRCFPGSSACVELDTFNDAGFQSTLADTLATMSIQVATPAIDSEAM